MRTLLSIALLALATALAAAEPAPGMTTAATSAMTVAAPTAPAQTAEPASNTTADHSKFKELQKAFASGPDVTKACISCHTEAAKQIQKTKHWTWDVVSQGGGIRLGKKNLVNNYCTSPISNEKDCMACHVGYGWENKNFDFAAQENVDCLVCHDSTGTYRKLPGYAGHPVYKDVEFPPGSGKIVKAVDLAKVAQSVAKTSRANCGACHFFGGGADGAKHGDLDSAMKSPSKYLDVHMDAKGLNFSCSTCHQASGHEVAGSRYALAAAEKGPAHVRGKADKEPASCQSCHGNQPHPKDHAKFNEHTAKLACQTCHIPEFARDNVGTELHWDWSTATTLNAAGKPYAVKDSAGRRAFDSKRGSFVWDSYVIPEYRWFNGTFKYTTANDKIDPTRTTMINEPGGKPGDADARIWPFKRHTGRQAYDKVNQKLIISHNGGEDDTALWHNFDWQKAVKAGMTTAGLPYSGEYGFAPTAMIWPITHMVAPKQDALRCEQCHVDNGRLAGVAGVYLPGRDRIARLDQAGWLLAALTLLGVLGHGALRIVASRKH